MMKTMAVILIALVMTGCASMSPQARWNETTKKCVMIPPTKTQKAAAIVGTGIVGYTIGWNLIHAKNGVSQKSGMNSIGRGALGLGLVMYGLGPTAANNACKEKEKAYQASK